MSGLDAAYFDDWYAAKRDAPILETLKQRHLGHLVELRGTSLLPLDGLREVAATLALAPGRRLLDLACGTGGFGLWVARETGCDVVGVDFSAVALDAARSLAGEFGDTAGRAEFRLGELTATGLPDAAVDAVMVLDSIQFAAGAEVAVECRRVLRRGGRIVLTGWEPVDRFEPSHSERMRACDLAGSLEAAAFADVRRGERPAWQAAERTFWEDVVRHDPAEHPALPSAAQEGTRTLAKWGELRRVLASATCP